MPKNAQKRAKKCLKVQKSVKKAVFHSINATICTCRESWCLLYAGFFFTLKLSLVLQVSYHSKLKGYGKTCWCSCGCDINPLQEFQVAKYKQFLRLQIANIHVYMQQTEHFQGSSHPTNSCVTRASVRHEFSLCP